MALESRPQNLERAFALVQKALALDDSLSFAHGLLSLVYRWKKQPTQALAEGEQAIALDPNDADSYAMQAQSLYLIGRPEEAIGKVEQAMRLNPRYPPWYLAEAGAAYFFTGRYTEAIAALKTCLLHTPDFLPAHVFLSHSYIAQWVFQLSDDPQVLSQGFEAAQRALALNDFLPGAHMALGVVYLFQKQYEQAVTEMERTITLDPDDALGYTALAEM